LPCTGKTAIPLTENPDLFMAALISHSSARSVVAYDQGRAIEAREYLAAVHHMATRLPAHGHVLNLCVNRYHFAVVMGAALLRRQPLLLPSTRIPEMLLQLRQHYPGLHAVTDQATQTSELPQVVFEAGPSPAEATEFEVPWIDENQIAAYVFTSGSTGQPVPHAKHWGPLVRDALAEGLRVRQHLPPSKETDNKRPAFIVTGTVPAQHMYGFESTVLMPLHNHAALDAGHPFYPADIAAALQGTPAPRVLVSTPFHLRTQLESGVATPTLALLMSATAPLAPQLAGRAEAALGAPLLEIYGSTETGQVASRRTTASELWQTFDGIVIREQAGTGGESVFIASGGHVEGQVPLSDVLDLHSPTRFALLGRHADMVNIAGKRTSLAYLNHQLNSIPGVTDGALYWPQSNNQDAQTRIQRPMAFVVAPSLSEAELAHALRERVDPAFMPRPIFFLPQLPRNPSGKLPQQVLVELAQTCKAMAHG
jgi:acyl-coenzyme A synthetase/AMP-(fatty) acid ligase